jgi:glucose-6-phosphate isomerase
MSADASILRKDLEARDETLWPEGNVSANRLGWLNVASEMKNNTADIEAWASEIGAEQIVLIGMGGSSLGPEVLRACSGNSRLYVLDTTDPATISSISTDKTFFLVSSKSGGTLEIRTLFSYFWNKVSDGSRFAAVTDPGTELESLAKEKEFNRAFINPPDIGGRYSVLSYFGLVPAALMGYDLTALLEAAVSTDLNEAVQLGISMGEASQSGRDKVTIKTPNAYASFGLWVEQLIAESTGKSGKGCIPIPTTDNEDGADRFAVSVDPGSPNDLGREFLRWEVATAIAGHILEIDPFDEPNVTESKENTKRVLDNLPLPNDESSNVDPGALMGWLKEQFRDRDYVSLQAYVPFAEEQQLNDARKRVRDSLGGVAVTAGFGPRFLHSTGQLHKGGPNTCIAVQVLPRTMTAEGSIPDFPYDFNTLIRAQAEGDLQSLKTHGRRVARVYVDSLDELQ